MASCAYQLSRTYQKRAPTCFMAAMLTFQNSCSGFPLALNSVYNYALGGIILALAGFGMVTFLIKRCIDKRIRRMDDTRTDAPSGYQAEPWLATGQASSNPASFEMGSLRKQGSVTASELRAPPPSYS